MTFKIEKYPQDIAETLIELSHLNDGNIAIDQIRNDLICALYDIKATCENEYNHDYWKTLYRTLEAVVYAYEVDKRG